VLRNGVQVFPAMLDAIRSARRSVDLSTFQYAEGQVIQDFSDALIERAQAGVRVRMIVDAIGSRWLPRAHVERLAEGGVDFEYFRPLSNLRFWEHENRTHRKVLVVDNRLGFAGGVNTSKEWMGDARNPDEWRDTHLRIAGPAVDGLIAAFATDWVDAGGWPASSTTSSRPGAGRRPPRAGRAGLGREGLVGHRQRLAALLTLAKRKVRITSAYFAPDDHFLDLLGDAAGRGVDVEVMLPGKNADQRFVQLAAEAQFERLLDAGVRIWSYQPTMIHAKIVLVDDVVACVGSANFDRRSMKLNHEVEVMVLDRGVVAELDRHYDEDVANSEQIIESRWAHRSHPQRALENLVRPLRGRF
jgi:cardiolipin synthase